jgi:hypothetical protein
MNSHEVLGRLIGFLADKGYLVNVIPEQSLLTLELTDELNLRSVGCLIFFPTADEENMVGTDGSYTARELVRPFLEATRLYRDTLNRLDNVVRV